MHDYETSLKDNQQEIDKLRNQLENTTSDNLEIKKQNQIDQNLFIKQELYQLQQQLKEKEQKLYDFEKNYRLKDSEVLHIRNLLKGQQQDILKAMEQNNTLNNYIYNHQVILGQRKIYKTNQIQQIFRELENQINKQALQISVAQEQKHQLNQKCTQQVRNNDFPMKKKNDDLQASFNQVQIQKQNCNTIRKNKKIFK